MRITQSMIHRNYMKGLTRTYSNMSKSLEKLTTGRKFTKGWEDVSSATRALSLRDQLSTSEQRLASIDDPKARIDSAYSNLMSVNEILVSAQEKVLKGLSGEKAEQRDVLAKELDSLKDQVLQFMNAEFSDKYLFGGTQNGGAPFKVNDAGELLYNGINVDSITKNADGKYVYMDAGVEQPVPLEKDTYIDLGLGLSVNGNEVDPRTAFKTSFSGLDILGVGRGGTPDVPNNLYNILDELSETFTTEPYNAERAQALNAQLIQQTDKLMGNVTELSSRADFLSKTADRFEEDILNIKTLQQKLEFCDEAEETAYLKQYQSNWQATLQYGSYALPQSIFDFMR